MNNFQKTGPIKPSFHKVPLKSGDSFSVRRDLRPHFESIWHYHPEMELHYTVKGTGVKFIGDNVSNFSDGDMIFLGPNLPHTWRCAEEFFQNDPGLHVEAIVLHFLPECFGKEFLSIPETALIRDFFEASKRGFLIKEPAKSVIVKLLNDSLESEGIDRVIIMVNILKQLINADKSNISDFSNHSPTIDIKMSLFDSIYTYALKNYNREISLDEIANHANMSISSFCRTFKVITKKTFVDFLIEIRVSNACRHLIEEDLDIQSVALKSGFNNLSNFYRQFKKIKGCTPLFYKNEYLNNLQNENKF
ncbi:MAG: AraC family transcriptional regulator [Kaistella sp.]